MKGLAFLLFLFVKIYSFLLYSIYKSRGNRTLNIILRLFFSFLPEKGKKKNENIKTLIVSHNFNILDFVCCKLFPYISDLLSHV